MTALFVVAPVFGTREIPAQAKIGLSAVLSLAILPLASPNLPHNLPTSVFEIAAQLTGEIAIGLMLGFAASLLFFAVRIGGDIIDFQMGFTQASSFNPEFNETISPFANLQYRYAMVLFLLSGGHWIVLRALLESFKFLPVSQLVVGMHGVSAFTDITYATLVTGLQVAAPGAAVLLITDVAFAFLNRAAPQIQVYYLGMPVKIVAGLITMAVVLPSLSYVVSQMIISIPVQAQLPLLRALHR